MVNLKPDTQVQVDVPKAQITYMAKNSKYSYDQIVKLIHAILNDVLIDTKKDLKIWINNKVAKRTGQLRKDLIEWMDGSGVGENIMELVLGTYIPYAEDVAGMTTSQVRHNKEWGYVYYPNKMGISSKRMPKGNKKILLDDPRAIGFFLDKIIRICKR